jgi:hypothetical protein
LAPASTHGEVVSTAGCGGKGKGWASHPTAFDVDRDENARHPA